jgi:hypothetical protein
MKTGTALILIGVGGFVLYEVTKLKSAANTVQIIFQGIQPQGPLDYNLQFLIQNVSNTAAQLNALSGTVSINNNVVGNLSNFTPTEIPATSQQVINIDFKPSLIGLSSEIVQLVTQGAGQTLNFAVNGSMNVNGLLLPFNVNNSVTL